MDIILIIVAVVFLFAWFGLKVENDGVSPPMGLLFFGIGLAALFSLIW